MEAWDIGDKDPNRILSHNKSFDIWS
jgi:hypothetical protein